MDIIKGRPFWARMESHSIRLESHCFKANTGVDTKKLLFFFLYILLTLKKRSKNASMASFTGALTQTYSCAWIPQPVRGSQQHRSLCWVWVTGPAVGTGLLARTRAQKYSHMNVATNCMCNSSQRVSSHYELIQISANMYPDGNHSVATAYPWPNTE